jgi:hypothetical protein
MRCVASPLFNDNPFKENIMQTKITALILVLITAAVVVTWPYYANSRFGNPLPIPGQNPVPVDPVHQAQKIQAVFVLDTTGSMSGLIQTAKEKIWSIASTMASAQNAPVIEIGLVAYRDQGDAYVTRITDLSSDLDSVYAKLMEFQAQGGGDTPESVNAALRAAVDDISWGQGKDTYQVIFLVGDAPPHMDYPGEEQFPSIVSRAASRNIVVNTIRCGTDHATGLQWQQIAGLAQGRYFSVDQAAEAIAVATPFDNDLAAISKQLDETRLAFGDEEKLANAVAKSVATEKVHQGASVEVRARRAAFNAKLGGRTNAYGADDLIEAVTSGKVAVDELDLEALPEPMRDMTVVERNEYVQAKKDKREQLDVKLQELVKKRADYISSQAPAAAAESSFEYQLFDTVKEQAAKVGLTYEGETPEL